MVLEPSGSLDEGVAGEVTGRETRDGDRHEDEGEQVAPHVVPLGADRRDAPFHLRRLLRRDPPRSSVSCGTRSSLPKGGDPGIGARSGAG